MMKRVAGLVPHITAAGHQVTIVAQDTAENRDYFSEVEAEKIFVSGSGILREIQQKARILRNRSPDVVYACGWGIRNLSALLGNTAIVEHAELLSANHESGILKRQKNLLLEWLSILFADGLVLASQYLLRTYEERDRLGLTEKRRLPYGLSLEAEPKGGKKGDRSGTGDPNEGTTRVLYMGSLYASYGIFDIVQSVPHVVETGEDTKYVILGDGPDRQRAIEQAQSLGVSDSIHFEGYVDEAVLDNYLASADVFLAPMFETVKDKARCPSKIPMYMRHRTPIVTCEIGEVPMYLEDKGFYYASGDPQSMARQIVRASKSPGPVDYDLQRVSWEHVATQFFNWVEQDVSLPKKKVEA